MAKISILQVEDNDIKKRVNYAEVLREQIERQDWEYQITDNLKSAMNKIDEQDYDCYVLDGQFPSDSKGDPNKTNFINLYEYMSNKVSKEKIVVWSNSTTVHNFCHKNGITYFSKKHMVPQDYIKKGNNPVVIAQRRDAEGIIKEILQKLSSIFASPKS